MFRFNAHSFPHASFANGAKSVYYMGQQYSRRHFASTRSPLLAGFVNPLVFTSSGTGALARAQSAMMNATDAAQSMAVTPAADMISSLALMTELMLLAARAPNWNCIRCSCPDWCHASVLHGGRLQVQVQPSALRHM